MQLNDYTTLKSIYETYQNSLQNKVHKKDTTLTQLQNDYTSLEAIRESIKDRKQLQVKKHVAYAASIIQGIYTGILDGDIGITNYKDIVNTKLLPKIQLILESVDSKPEPKTEKEEIFESFEQLNEFVTKNSNNTDEYKAALDKARYEADIASSKQLLISYTNKYRNKIPSKVDYFTIIRLPVVPIFKDFTISSTKLLDKLNISHTQVGSNFVVFDNCYVLAFNRRTITNNPVKKTKKAIAKLNFEYDGFVFDLVDKINAKSQIKYDRVSKGYKANHKNADVLLVWLMPIKELKLLRRSSIQGSLEIVNWAFPWERGFLA